jgi:hypothetical protein
MEDIVELEGMNEQFIEAFRQGSWELLEPILAPSFSYLDGATGEVWSTPATSTTYAAIPRRRSRSIRS